MAKKKDKKVPPQKRKPLNENSSELAALLQQAKAANPIPAPVSRQPQPQIKKKIASPAPVISDEKKLAAVMPQEQIREALRKIENGTRFRVQYKNSATGDLIYLRSMLATKVVEGQPFDEMLLMAVGMSNSWETPTNRIFILKATNWSEGWIGRFEYAIEAIEILS